MQTAARPPDVRPAFYDRRVAIASITIPPCALEPVDRLIEVLGVHRVTAEALVRRGFEEPGDALAYLDGETPLHDPFLLGAMDEACTLIEGAIAAGTRIVVHGDYDVDGVCATALTLLALRLLGAEVEAFLPSRFVEGYGLEPATVDRLADDGVGLIVTVDCGITAVEAVERARERGVAIVITDHHRAGPVLPSAPLVTSRSIEGAAYPFADLCGTGVAFKLAQALWSRRFGGAPTDVPLELEELLDLVALATVADVVPLVDENRSLVRRGMRRLGRGDRPGLRALMVSAGVDPARIRSSDLGFRLAPRINAAGRLGHPDLALQLILADGRADAKPLAEQIEERNRERQRVEETILRAAARAIEAQPESATAKALVAWGDDWHEGVIGIVASRLVERYGRPVVLIALDGERGKGSGRSISSYDLHAGLASASAHLERFGGHRAAAGLTIARAQLEQFAAAFRAHAEETLDPADLGRRHRVDAVLAVDEVSIDLARELERFEPCGLGNPGINLLVPSADLRSVEAMGEGGKHLRLQVSDAGARCGAVAFGRGRDADLLSEPHGFDVICRLEVNEWRGSLSPRLMLREAVALPERGPSGGRALAARLASAGRVACVLEQVSSLGELPRGIDDLILARPPVHPDEQVSLDALPTEVTVHVAYGGEQIEAAIVALTGRELRPVMTALWRAAGDPSQVAYPSELVDLAARVLCELGLAEPSVTGIALVPGAEKRDPGTSVTYAAHAARLAESRRYLSSLGQPEPALALAG